MYEILQNEHNDKEFQKEFLIFYCDGVSDHHARINGHLLTANHN